ncbi:MAG: phenylacetate--CoA ligase family protein [Candidatus Aminicenantes bacterium]
MNNFEGAKKELTYAYENVSFFRKLIDNANLSIKDIRTAEDFRGIPATNKSHYRKNFPVGVLAKGYSLNDRGLYRVQSSGTTGERLVTIEVGLLYFQRAVECFSVYPSLLPAFNTNPRRHCRYAAPNCSDVECANPYTTMQDRILKDGTLVLSVYHDLLTTTENILKTNIQEIETYQPQMYYIDPTHLAFLSRYMKKNVYTPPQAPIFASYTPCTKISKRQILETFGQDTTFLQFVSMSELGWLALQCPQGNLHINTNSYYIELLANNRPAQKGELAELYVTSLDNGCMPFIRYRTGDIYQFIADKCPCGHQFSVVRFEGRLCNFIFRNNRTALAPRELDDLIGDAGWMDLYKLEQTGESDFLFRFIPNERYEKGMETYIQDALYQKLGNIRLVMEKTNYIPTERSGKFLSCVSRIGEQKVNEGYTV